MCKRDMSVIFLFVLCIEKKVTQNSDYCERPRRQDLVCAIVTMKIPCFETNSQKRRITNIYMCVGYSYLYVTEYCCYSLLIELLSSVKCLVVCMFNRELAV